MANTYCDYIQVYPRYGGLYYRAHIGLPQMMGAHKFSSFPPLDLEIDRILTVCAD